MEAQEVPGLEVQVHQLPGLTPTILLTLEGHTLQNILIYGHLDKQPEFDSWEDGLAPSNPVIGDEKLYGRGGADDGYAIYSAIVAIKSLLDQKLPRPRINVIIEASEESGSPDFLLKSLVFLVELQFHGRSFVQPKVKSIPHLDTHWNALAYDPTRLWVQLTIASLHL